MQIPIGENMIRLFLLIFLVMSVSAKELTDKDSILAIQRILKELNYYHGEIDGISGKGTKRAISQFQSAHEIKADGLLSKSFLTSAKSLWIEGKAKRAKNKIEKKEPIDDGSTFNFLGLTIGKPWDWVNENEIEKYKKEGSIRFIKQHKKDSSTSMYYYHGNPKLSTANYTIPTVYNGTLISVGAMYEVDDGKDFYETLKAKLERQYKITMKDELVFMGGESHGRLGNILFHIHADIKIGEMDQVMVFAADENLALKNAEQQKLEKAKSLGEF